MSEQREWRQVPQRYRRDAVQCAGCGRVLFPPGPVCRVCGGREFSAAQVGERGTVVAVTRVSGGGPRDRGVAVVELSDGVRLLCQLADTPAALMQAGLPVRLALRRLEVDEETGRVRYGHKAVPVHMAPARDR